MSDLGKIDRPFFDKTIYPNLGTERDDVRLGPQHGVDFGAIDIGENVLVTATDPIFLMPSLGFERAAWFAFHILMSDVSVSGVAPTHFSVDFNLPPAITDEEFATVWKTFNEEARKFGVNVVTGHTGRYAGCSYPMVGGGTVLGVGDPDDLVRPDGARPGDRVLITKGPAIEATGLLANQFADLMTDELPETIVSDATARFDDMSPVRDALTAATAGPVTAMHDATECGVFGGLYELARAAGVHLDVGTDPMPIQPGVEEACDFFDIDPWIAISEGTLLLAVAPEGVEDVLDVLEEDDIPAAEIGAVSKGLGVTVDGEPIDHPERDPFWATFEEFMEQAEARE